MSFGTRLQELRISRSMTRKELSDATGLTRQQIAHYESGENKPYLDTAARLAEALDCSLDELAERIRIPHESGDESMNDLGYTERLCIEDRLVYVRPDNTIIKLGYENGKTAVYKINMHRPSDRLDLTYAELLACADIIRAMA